jgi:cell division protease FtsH
MKVTNIARSMVTRFGMVPALGQVAYESEQSQFLATPGGGLKSREFSEATAREIDTAVKDIIDRAFAKAVMILSDRRATLERGAQLLLQKETLSEEDLHELQGPAAAAKAA